MEWYERMVRARKARGLSRKELAEKAGTSYDNISKYETGKIRTPREDLLNEIARVLDVTPIFLRYGVKPTEPDQSSRQFPNVMPPREFMNYIENDEHDDATQALAADTVEHSADERLGGPEKAPVSQTFENIETHTVDPSSLSDAAMMEMAFDIAEKFQKDMGPDAPTDPKAIASMVARFYKLIKSRSIN